MWSLLNQPSEVSQNFVKDHSCAKWANLLVKIEKTSKVFLFHWLAPPHPPENIGERQKMPNIPEVLIFNATHSFSNRSVAYNLCSIDDEE